MDGTTAKRREIEGLTDKGKERERNKERGRVERGRKYFAGG